MEVVPMAETHQVRWVLAVHVPLDDNDTANRENIAYEFCEEVAVDLQMTLRDRVGGNWKVTLD